MSSMIVYDNRDLWFILHNLTGSVMFRRTVIMSGGFSTVLGICLLGFEPEVTQTFFKMSRGVARVYGMIIAFVIVFRIRIAFDRFFTGVHDCQTMYSKWRDAFMQLCCFYETSIKQHAQDPGKREIFETMVRSKGRLLHWFSLLSAIAVDQLRRQDEDETEVGDVVGWESSIMPRNKFENRMLVRPSELKAFGASHSNHNVLHDNGTGSRSGKLSRRTGGAFTQDDNDPTMSSSSSSPGSIDLGPPGVGSSGLRSVRSGGVASRSWCHTTTRNANVRKKDRERVKREIAEAKQKKEGQMDDFGSFSTMIGPITQEERRQLAHSHDRVLTVIKWILVEISAAHMDGRLLTAAPVLSRVYQELSNGMLGFAMAMKVVMCPMPFPFSQVVLHLLAFFYVACPVITLEVLLEADEEVMQESQGRRLDRFVLSVVFNFLCSAGYCALNEIAVELEDPFGEDANDFPVHVQQWHVCWALEDIFFSGRPRTRTGCESSDIEREEVAWSDRLRAQQNNTPLFMANAVPVWEQPAESETSSAFGPALGGAGRTGGKSGPDWRGTLYKYHGVPPQEVVAEGAFGAVGSSFAAAPSAAESPVVRQPGRWRARNFILEKGCLNYEWPATRSHPPCKKTLISIKPLAEAEFVQMPRDQASRSYGQEFVVQVLLPPKKKTADENTGSRRVAFLLAAEEFEKMTVFLDAVDKAVKSEQAILSPRRAAEEAKQTAASLIQATPDPDRIDVASPVGSPRGERRQAPIHYQLGPFGGSPRAGGALVGIPEESSNPGSPIGDFASLLSSVSLSSSSAQPQRPPPAVEADFCAPSAIAHRATQVERVSSMLSQIGSEVSTLRQEAISACRAAAVTPGDPVSAGPCAPSATPGSEMFGARGGRQPPRGERRSRGTAEIVRAALPTNVRGGCEPGGAGWTLPEGAHPPGGA